ALYPLSLHDALPISGVKPSPHAVANRSRLFENLLQHEVVVATLFDGFEREFQRMNVWGHRNVLDRLDRQAIGIDNRNFTVVEIRSEEHTSELQSREN